MNEENETIWKPGDIVIHDADTKREDMLMVVILVDGHRVKSRYLFRGDEIYENDMKYLHCPATYGIVRCRIEGSVV